MGKITNLLIGILVISFIFTGFIVFMADIFEKTSIPQDDFSENNYSKYNRLNQISNITRDIQQTSNTTVEQSTSDILGSYFKQGYSAFRLTLESGSIASGMLSDAEKEVKINDSTNLFFPMLTAIILIIVVFGIIIYVVVGKDV